jgi:hypothetical protein
MHQKQQSRSQPYGRDLGCEPQAQIFRVSARVHALSLSGDGRAFKPTGNSPDAVGVQVVVCWGSLAS